MTCVMCLVTFQKELMMYRPEIRVFDCTIRDGGLMNNHLFDHDFVREVYQGLSDAGVDYVELGYKNSNIHGIFYKFNRSHSLAYNLLRILVPIL